MKRVFLNCNFSLPSEGGEIWSQSNGRTKKNLVLVAKGIEGEYKEGEPFLVESVKVLEKDRTAFIFLHGVKPYKPSMEFDPKTVGIFLNSNCGYSSEGSRFEASSIGGYGNSESKFGVYDVGIEIEVYTYKHRQESSYFKLDSKTGWKNVRPAEKFADQAEEI